MITDQTMSQMTGLELSLEALKIRPGFPIILCSGFGQTITPEGVKAMGIREFLMKPVLIEELSLAIRRVLGPVIG
ncbi:MAG: response regulator [Syntrophales bacterium LBB04]|nr:response regulator [Syntrophales bacterium LBB04]